MRTKYHARRLCSTTLCLAAIILTTGPVSPAEPVVVINAVVASEELAARAAQLPVAASIKQHPPIAPHADPAVGVTAAPEVAKGIEAASAKPPAQESPDAVAPIAAAPPAPPALDKPAPSSVLAANNPGFSVIECVAGCVGPVGTVVYFKPLISTDTGKADLPGGIQTAASPTPAEATTITCVAGCYDTPKTYVAYPGRTVSQQAAAPIVETTMTPAVARMPQMLAAKAAPLRRAHIRKARARAKPVWPAYTQRQVWRSDLQFRPNYRSY